MGKRTKKQPSASASSGVQSPISGSPARSNKGTAQTQSTVKNSSRPTTPSAALGKAAATKASTPPSSGRNQPTAASPAAVPGLVSATSKRPSVALTEHVVLTRTKANSLSEVTQLNVWGNQLDDISIVSKLPNLTVLSVSFNRIGSLAPLANCTQLQELYARHNAIGKPLIEKQGMTPKDALQMELRNLAKCTKLTTLWLCENPCADAVGHQEQSEYRLAVIRAVPSLKRLDDVVVSASERSMASTSAPASHKSKPTVCTASSSAPKITARPPTPLASSPSTSAHSGRGRSSTRRSGPAGQLEVVTASPTSPVAPAPFSPQDVRSVIPPEIPVVHGSHSSHGMAATSPRSRSISNSRVPLAELENRPPSPGGEHFTAQDVRRVIPPSVPVYTSASARHLNEHHEHHVHEHHHHQHPHSHGNSPSKSPARHQHSKSATTGHGTGLRPVSETHASWAANNTKTNTQAQRQDHRPSSATRGAWTTPAQAHQPTRAAAAGKAVHSHGHGDHSNNVLFAVLSLVKELDEKELAIVEKQVKDARIGSHAHGRQAAL